MATLEIPIVNLNIGIDESEKQRTTPILENEIKGIQVEHVALAGRHSLTELSREGHRSIYLFVKGRGEVMAGSDRYEIVPETILLPNAADSIRIIAAEDNNLHYLKVSSALTAQDLVELKALPKENTQGVYYAKFSDCQSYVEPIKSPNTVSRTILSNEYIPRIAMGTVQTKGPDEVGAHEHPMLEQIFLGLSKNNCTVYADDAQTNFPPYSVLHIPLGSRHSVAVDQGETLYYVWMDFFLDKKGEEWLKTHIVE
jgi:mannose-6-phosphate isomerase-like protein (cupin superfamily)